MEIEYEKVNVMHVVLSLEAGGLERIVADSTLAINNKMFNVMVCCFDRLGEFSDYLLSKGVDIVLLRKNQEHYDYLYPIKLMKLLKERNIHILHMHSGTFFLGTQSGILARTPVMVYTDHGRLLFESRVQILTDRFSGFFVDKIIAVSNELEKYLVHNIRLPKSKTITIINGVNNNVYRLREKPIALMNEFGISQYDKVIGTVGRLAEVKDQLTLIEAFNLVHKKIPNTVLILVGDGPMRKILSNKVVELKLDNCVTITGNRNDVPELLNMFDLFVLSSLSEGTSVALLEAMSSGIAPIVTNVGGNPSIVDDKVNGILVREKNVHELADNMIVLLKNEEKRKGFGLNAALKVGEQYSITKMVKEYERLYMGLLKAKLKAPLNLAISED